MHFFRRHVGRGDAEWGLGCDGPVVVHNGAQRLDAQWDGDAGQQHIALQWRYNQRVAGSQTLAGSGSVLSRKRDSPGPNPEQHDIDNRAGNPRRRHGGSTANSWARPGEHGLGRRSSGHQTSIINQGTIDADTAGATINVYPGGGNFINQGTIEATDEERSRSAATTGRIRGSLRPPTAGR